MTLQINNPEIVNLMIEERVARVEKQLEDLNKSRESHRQSLDTLWDTQLTMFDQYIHDEIEEEFASLLEAFSKLYAEPIPEYHLRVSCKHPIQWSSKAFAKLEFYPAHVDLIAGESADSASDFDEDTEIGQFMDCRSLSIDIALDADIKEGVVELLSLLEKAGDQYRSLSYSIENRDVLGRKLLAQLTAQTLKSDPEQFERIRAAIGGLEANQLCIGTADANANVIDA